MKRKSSLRWDFGTFGELSSSGAQPVVKEVKEENAVEKVEERKKPEEKKVEVPVVKNLDDDNISVPEKKKDEEKPDEILKERKEAENKNKGREVAG